MFTATLFITVKRMERSQMYFNCSVTQYNVVYPHNQLIKRNEELIYTTIWMTLENITLSHEKSQKQKTTYYMTQYVKYPEQASL